MTDKINVRRLMFQIEKNIGEAGRLMACDPSPFTEEAFDATVSEVLDGFKIQEYSVDSVATPNKILARISIVPKPCCDFVYLDLDIPIIS